MKPPLLALVALTTAFICQVVECVSFLSGSISELRRVTPNGGVSEADKYLSWIRQTAALTKAEKQAKERAKTASPNAVAKVEAVLAGIRNPAAVTKRKAFFLPGAFTGGRASTGFAMKPVSMVGQGTVAKLISTPHHTLKTPPLLKEMLGKMQTSSPHQPPKSPPLLKEMPNHVDQQSNPLVVGQGAAASPTSGPHQLLKSPPLLKEMLAHVGQQPKTPVVEQGPFANPTVIPHQTLTSPPPVQDLLTHVGQTQASRALPQTSVSKIVSSHNSVASVLPASLQSVIPNLPQVPQSPNMIVNAKAQQPPQISMPAKQQAQPRQPPAPKFLEKVSAEDSYQAARRAFIKERLLRSRVEEHVTNLTAALNNTERRVDNLTSALNRSEARVSSLASNLSASRSAFRQQEAKLRQRNLDIKNSPYAKSLESKLQEAQATIKALQLSLSRSAGDLDHERDVEQALREHRVGAVSHCREMLDDVHRTMSDERVLRFAAERNSSAIAAKLQSLMFRHANLSVELQSIESRLEDQKANSTKQLAENGKLKRELEQEKTARRSKSEELVRKIKDMDMIAKRDHDEILAVEDRGKRDEANLTNSFNEKLEQEAVALHVQKAHSDQVINGLSTQLRNLNITDAQLRSGLIAKTRELQQLQARAQQADLRTQEEHKALLAANNQSRQYFAQASKLQREVEILRGQGVQAIQRMTEFNSTVSKLQQQIMADNNALGVAARRYKVQGEALVNTQNQLNETSMKLEHAMQSQMRSTARIHQLWKALKKEKADHAVEKTATFQGPRQAAL